MDGPWVAFLNWAAKLTLGVNEFIICFALALAAVALSAVCRHSKAYTWALWLLIKTLLWVSVVPMFAFIASYLIEPMAGLRGMAAALTVQGVFMAATMAWMLPSSDEIAKLGKQRLKA